MSIWSAISVVLFLAFLGIGISRLLAMANKQSGGPLLSILAGVNIVAIVGAAFWLGSLPGQIENLGTQINQLSQDIRNVRQDVGTLTNEVFQNDDSLKIRATRTEEVLKVISPRVIREDFEREMQRLNQEIEKLRDENRKLQEQINALRAAAESGRGRGGI